MVRWVRAGFPFKRRLGGGHGLAPLTPERHFSKDSLWRLLQGATPERGRDCAWTDSSGHSKGCDWRACWRPNVRRGRTRGTSSQSGSGVGPGGINAQCLANTSQASDFFEFCCFFSHSPWLAYFHVLNSSLICGIIDFKFMPATQ